MNQFVLPPNYAMILNLHLSPILEHFDKGTYRFPIIQQRFTMLSDQIRKRYSIDLIDFGASITNANDKTAKGGLLPMGIQMSDTDSVPKIIIFIPALVERYNMLRSQYQLQYSLYFETSIVIGILHEMDHLALGLLGPKTPNIDKLCEDETKVWAQTCEHTIRPLRETYRLPLTDGDMKYYLNWVRIKRDGASQNWADFIRGIYSRIQYAPRK